MDSIHDKHDKEVERLKKKYPDLKHLWFGVDAGGRYFTRRGYLEIEEPMIVGAKRFACATTLAVIAALEKIERRACKTREDLLKEYEDG